MSYPHPIFTPGPRCELVAEYHCRRCGHPHRDFEPSYIPHYEHHEALVVRGLTLGDRFAREWERLSGAPAKPKPANGAA